MQSERKSSKIVEIEVDVSRFLDTQERILSEGEDAFIQIPFGGDNLTHLEMRMGGGLFGGRLYILGGIPSASKTMLGNNIADNICLAAIRCFFSAMTMVVMNLGSGRCLGSVAYTSSNLTEIALIKIKSPKFTVSLRLWGFLRQKYVVEEVITLNRWDAIIDQIVKSEKKAPVIIIDYLRKLRTERHIGELKSVYKDKAQTEAGRYLGEDRLNAKKPISDWDAAVLLKLLWESWNDVFRQTLGHAERSLVSELREVRNKWAHQEAFSSDDAYRALDSAAGCSPPISAPQADEIEKMKMELLRAALRRAGARREAQERRHRDRERGGGQPQALARGGDAAQGRGQRPLPAGRVRRRPLAGAPRRGDGRIPGPGRVLPPHLSDREPEADAGGRRAAPCRPGRRPGGAAPDQLRRRQDALDAGALPPVLRHRAERAGRHRRGDAGGRGEEAADRASAWCWWATRSRPATRSRSPTAPWCARCGASWPGSSAARRPSPASRPTTRRRPARATCCASSSRSTGPA